MGLVVVAAAAVEAECAHAQTDDEANNQLHPSTAHPHVICLHVRLAPQPMVKRQRRVASREVPGEGVVQSLVGVRGEVNTDAFAVCCLRGELGPVMQLPNDLDFGVLVDASRPLQEFFDLRKGVEASSGARGDDRREPRVGDVVHGSRCCALDEAEQRSHISNPVELYALFSQK